MARIATYYIDNKGKTEFGIRSFKSLKDYKSWQSNLLISNKKLTNIYWQDGYPGLDAWKFER